MKQLPPEALERLKEMRERAPNTWACTSEFDNLVRPFVDETDNPETTIWEVGKQMATPTVIWGVNCPDCGMFMQQGTHWHQHADGEVVHTDTLIRFYQERRWTQTLRIEEAHAEIMKNWPTPANPEPATAQPRPAQPRPFVPLTYPRMHICVICNLCREHCRCAPPAPNERRATPIGTCVVCLGKERDEAVKARRQAEESLEAAEQHVKILRQQNQAKHDKLQDCLLRVQQGYLNILEMRKLHSEEWAEHGQRFGALTREEIETVLAEIDAALKG